MLPSVPTELRWCHDLGFPVPPGRPRCRSSSPAGSTAELSVEGMHCDACVALIEETLGETEGVLTASVDLEAARAVVAYEPELIGVDAHRSVIADTGYTATPVG